MPPYVKGGVWTNVEDEMLKAGVAKYGLNQWGRVSTLLNQKTAKQCKARWFEWLDPSVKKNEWSREEDEKLLTLARLMPSQWRSIAPKVGRTAAQCIERYEKLLSDAESAESGLSLTTSDQASSSGKLRPGEIDPSPETKPARPDAVDMSDDEKEMLAEARARLANTQGKKAKRRDRERLLEENHRASIINKRRELRQAGISTKIAKKLKKGEIDYSGEIPFEHKPAPGLYDTTEEQEMNEKEKQKYDSLVQQRGLFMGSGEKKRKEMTDEQKASAAQQAAEARAQKLQQLGVDEQLAKRRRLDLPSPQVDDEEMEQIIKVGKRNEQLKGELGDTFAASAAATARSLPSSASTESVRDTSLIEKAQDLKRMTESQSSLLGAEEKELNDESFPMPGTRAAHQPQMDDEDGEDGATVEERRTNIRSLFAALPKPKNDFEIALPEDEEDEEEGEEEGDEEQPQNVSADTDHVVDRGERESQLARKRALELEKELKRRSQVVQRELPFPTKFEAIKIASASHPEIDEMVAKELKLLILSDAVKYKGRTGSTVPDLDDELKAEIDFEIEQEMEDPQPVETTSKPLPGLEQYDEDFSEKLTDALAESANAANETEKKLGLVYGGYAKRQASLGAKLEKLYGELNELMQEANVYQELADAEEISIQSRQNTLHSEVEFLTDRERAGQERYKYLQSILN